jgi:phenylacetaldehyde dehydrogenase
VVLKPAEQTPLTSLRLGELLLEAGVPAGVVNIVTGFGDAGAAIAAHHGVDKVAFTGSTEVGKLVMQAAGTTNLKKVTLELGGKSPNIIFADSALTPGGLDRAIQAAAMGVFFNQGQVCCAGSRVFIEQSVFDQVLEGIAKKARSVKVGDAFDPATEMGPLVSTEQHDRVRGYIHQGRKDGAHIVTGGTEHPDGVAPGGYFVRPTVITKTRPTMSVVAEEIFGPVIVAEPFTDIDDVIRQANNTVYGLAAGLHTSNISKANKVTAALKAGTVWVNTFNIFDAALPFGGYKQSGIGREMGPESLESYLETKSVVVAN